jgi:hypothetical protein
MLCTAVVDGFICHFNNLCNSPYFKYSSSFTNESFALPINYYQNLKSLMLILSIIISSASVINYTKQLVLSIGEVGWYMMCS